MTMHVRRFFQDHYGAHILTALDAIVLLAFSLWWVVTHWNSGDAWVRAEPFAATALALFLAAVIYEICNPPPDAKSDTLPNDVHDAATFVAKAEDMLRRRRADHTEVGSNLATLLGFVATGGGIIAVTTTTKIPMTPLLECAAASILGVLVLCLLGLRPEHHAEPTTMAQRFGAWAKHSKSSNTSSVELSVERCYLEYLAHSCDRYERFRRVRRAYYIYAGWVFVLVLAAVGLDVVSSDCAFPQTTAAVDTCPRATGTSPGVTRQVRTTVEPLHR